MFLRIRPDNPCDLLSMGCTADLYTRPLLPVHRVGEEASLSSWKFVWKFCGRRTRSHALNFILLERLRVKLLGWTTLGDVGNFVENFQRVAGLSVFKLDTKEYFVSLII